MTKKALAIIIIATILVVAIILFVFSYKPDAISSIGESLFNINSLNADTTANTNSPSIGATRGKG